MLILMSLELGSLTTGKQLAGKKAGATQEDYAVTIHCM